MTWMTETVSYFLSVQPAKEGNDFNRNWLTPFLSLQTNMTHLIDTVIRIVCSPESREEKKGERERFGFQMPFTLLTTTKYSGCSHFFTPS